MSYGFVQDTRFELTASFPKSTASLKLPVKSSRLRSRLRSAAPNKVTLAVRLAARSAACSSLLAARCLQLAACSSLLQFDVELAIFKRYARSLSSFSIIAASLYNCGRVKTPTARPPSTPFQCCLGFSHSRQSGLARSRTRPTPHFISPTFKRGGGVLCGCSSPRL